VEERGSGLETGRSKKPAEEEEIDKLTKRFAVAFLPLKREAIVGEREKMEIFTTKRTLWGKGLRDISEQDLEGKERSLNLR